MIEIFVDITGYEGKYQISNLGRVKSLKRMARKKYGFRIVQEKILTPSKKENDYLFIGLHKNQKTTCHYIHRLVALHFIPNPENKPDVNHIESNKDDNRVFMLEWVTKSENLYHSFKQGTHKAQKGTISTRAKLNDEKVIEIRTRYGHDGNTIRSLATEYGVHHSVVDGILKGKRWNHVNIKTA